MITPFPHSLRDLVFIFTNDRMVAIMNIIQQRPISVKHIESEYRRLTNENIRQASVSQCLKRLSDHNLVNKQKKGREVYYQLKYCTTKTIIEILNELV